MNKFILVALGVAFASTSFAAKIMSPVSVLSNSAGEVAAGDLLNAFNRNGLVTAFTNGVTDYDTYVASNPMHTFVYNGNEWFSPSGVNNGTIELDLGADYIVSGAALWNEEFSGLNSMEFTTSLLADFSVSLSGGVLNPFNNPHDVDYGVSNHSMSARVARYIRIDINGPQADYRWDGLSMGELAFRVEAVPEPTTMIALGLGAVAMLRRRKN